MKWMMCMNKVEVHILRPVYLLWLSGVISGSAFAIMDHNLKLAIANHEIPLRELLARALYE